MGEALGFFCCAISVIAAFAYAVHNRGNKKERR